MPASRSATLLDLCDAYAPHSKTSHWGMPFLARGWQVDGGCPRYPGGVQRHPCGAAAPGKRTEATIFGRLKHSDLANVRGAFTETPGAVVEWSKAADLKSAGPEMVPWVRIPPAPPLAPAKAFSRSSCGRIFPLFSGVMRVRLLTGTFPIRSESVLSGPIFSRPVAFAVLVNFPQLPE